MANTTEGLKMGDRLQMVLVYCKYKAEAEAAVRDNNRYNLKIAAAKMAIAAGHDEQLQNSLADFAKEHGL